MKRIVPHLFTLFNLFLGCLSIVYLFNGNFMIVPHLIFWACVADFFDGFAARMLKVSSPMGLQLDSLADMVTFGVVPSMVLYHFLLKAFQLPPEQAVMYAAPAFILALFSALRLAKFNIDTRQTTGFLGLATPGSTAFVVSLIPIVENNVFGLQNLVLNPIFLYCSILILSLLLIVDLPMFSLKFKHYRWRGNEIRYIFITTVFSTLGIVGFAGIPFVILFYIFLSVINNLLLASPKMSDV